MSYLKITLNQHDQDVGPFRAVHKGTYIFV